MGDTGPVPFAAYLVLIGTLALLLVLVILRLVGILDRARLSRVVAAFILIEGLSLLLYVITDWLR